MSASRLFPLLQHGDSFFPAGMTAFSWGLEQMSSEGLATGPEDVRRFIEGQLRRRWSCFDRAFLLAAHASRAHPAALARVDRLCQASVLAEELRTGSAKAGQALIAVHAKLGTPGAADYRAEIAAHRAHGHLPVAQGFLWGTLGFSESEAAVLSAYGFAAGSVGAAIRLGLLGHVDGQRILAAMAEPISALVEAPAPSLAEASSFTPAADIAAMRHEVAEQRLFAN